MSRNQTTSDSSNNKSDFSPFVNTDSSLMDKFTRREVIVLVNTRPLPVNVDSKVAAYTQGVQLPHCNLNGLDLRNLPLDRANFIGSHLEQTRLDGCNLESANFEWANLKGASLVGADLKKANLRMADLRNANLTGADLKFVSLQGARLDGTILKNVNLQFANLGGCNFRDAITEGANMHNVYGLEEKLERGSSANSLFNTTSAQL